MLTNGNVAVGDHLPAALCRGPVGHQANAAHHTFAHSLLDATIHRLAVAKVVSTDDELLHGGIPFGDVFLWHQVCVAS